MAGSSQGSEDMPVLLRCKRNLEELGYNEKTVVVDFSIQRHFLDYLRRRNVALKTVRSSDVAHFMKSKFGQDDQQGGHSRSRRAHWQDRHRTAIHRMLRMVFGEWPPQPPLTESERRQHDVLEKYGRWLTDVRGVSQHTVRKDSRTARSFLQWLRRQARQRSLDALNVATLDAFLAWRLPGLRRCTRSGVCNSLRSFLRYLYSSKQTSRDLSRDISGPVRYGDEEIPQAFSEEQIKKLLETTRRDHSPRGLRDYAMLLLLATYGLRGGEVVRLSLEDIDWRGDKLRVRRSKTQVESHLPLLSLIGNALLRYLKHGRPKSESRQIFLRIRAPIRPFFCVSGLNGIIDSRLKEAGITVKGRHGAHAFRFARATSLLRGSVPLKTIGDLLGHRTEESTKVYLKLGTEDLRAVSLELPRRDRHARLA